MSKRNKKKRAPKEHRINLNPDTVIRLGNTIVKAIEKFLKMNEDTILAEIYYALFDVAVFYHEGLDRLPSAILEDEEDTDDEECLCDDCKRKKDLSKTKYYIL